MEIITKWFAAPEGAPSFEIDVDSQSQAIQYIKRNFKGSGEVRLLECTYHCVSTTPFMVKT